MHIKLNLEILVWIEEKKRQRKRKILNEYYIILLVYSIFCFAFVLFYDYDDGGKYVFNKKNMNHYLQIREHYK